MNQRNTDGVKNAWKYAISQAQKLGSQYVGIEHLLMGIAHQKDTVGGKILQSLGSTVDKIEQHLERKAYGIFCLELYISPRTKHVLEMSLIEANKMRSNYVGTEHVLLAILHEGDS